MIMLRQLSCSLRHYSTASAKNSLPKSCDIVIMGGGVFGLSTAYHLTKLGYNNIVVLERDKITSGTSWHSNGLIWRLRPSDIDIQLLTRTQQLLSKELLTHEGVDSTGFVNNGGLFLAHNQERIREYQRIHGIAKYFGIESHMMDRKQILQMLNPMIDPKSDLIGGLYSPGDGYCDPTMYCNALRKASKAKVIEDCEVIGINTKPITGIGQKRQITGVRVKLNNGAEEEIKTDIVVNSSGVWAPIIAKFAGIEHMPQETFEHGYLITQPIEHVSPLTTPNIRDHDLSVAFRISGKSFQISYYEEDPVIITEKTSSLTPFILFDFNWERASVNMENSTKLMPIIETVGIKSTLCGPESFTPDHKPLLGEDFDVRGFYYGSGFNSLGISMSGGCGRELAKWIVNGRPELEMFAYDIRRFNRNLMRDNDWVRMRSTESYAKNYGIVYPFDELTSARDAAKKDPLSSSLEKYGVVYQERHGRQRSGWFDDDHLKSKLTLEEYIHLNNSFEFDPNSRLWCAVKRETNACLTSSAMFNLSSMGKFMIEGENATRAMQWLIPNNIEMIPDGGSISTYMLNSYGGIASEVIIHKLNANRFYLISGDISVTHVHNHILSEIDRNNITDVTVTDHTDKIGILSLQGPKSRSLIEHSLGIDLSAIGDNCHSEFKINKIILRAINTTQLCANGWELHTDFGSLQNIYQKIMEHANDRRDITNAGYKTYESLKMSKGLLTWGIELRSDDIPFYFFDTDSAKFKLLGPNAQNLLKVNVSRVKYESEQFSGSHGLKTSAEFRENNCPKKYYILMHLHDRSVLPQGMEPILSKGIVIGMVRSGTYSFVNDCPIAIGYIYADRIHSDTLPLIEVTDIEINKNLYKAKVLSLK